MDKPKKTVMRVRCVDIDGVHVVSIERPDGERLWDKVYGEDTNDHLTAIKGLKAKAYEFEAAYQASQHLLRENVFCAARTASGSRTWSLQIRFNAHPDREATLTLEPYKMISYYVDTLEHLIPGADELCIDLGGANFGVRESVLTPMAGIRYGIVRFREYVEQCQSEVTHEFYETGRRR